MRTLAFLVFASAWLVAPSSALAAPSCADLHHIVIRNNKDFNADNGVAGGKGTARSPYLFKGCNVSSLEIQDTSKAVRIVDSRIDRLTLNYIGPMVDVRNNDIGDLRVNENIERTGMPTSATIMYNRIGQVGQMRHFDGRFAYNTVGQKPDDAWSSTWEAWESFFQSPVVTFDGFNGASFDHNTLYGPLEARLHGHHHSSSFGSTSHMHSGHEHHKVDHTVRYHQVKITDNTIHSKTYYALAWLDTIHSANDRTATSETNPELEKPHVHYTKALIANNKLVGAGLRVDVFNADDELHHKPSSGSLDIVANRITLAERQVPLFNNPSTGIDVQDAGDVKLNIVRNSISGVVKQSNQAAGPRWLGYGGEGIRLNQIDAAHVLLDGNSVSNFTIGVLASDLTKSVHWTIRGLKTTNVDQAVSYDQSVANKPHMR